MLEWLLGRRKTEAKEVDCLVKKPMIPRKDSCYKIRPDDCVAIISIDDEGNILLSVSAPEKTGPCDYSLHLDNGEPISTAELDERIKTHLPKERVEILIDSKLGQMRYTQFTHNTEESENV